jgi:hypothetical protein
MEKKKRKARPVVEVFVEGDRLERLFGCGGACRRLCGL